MCLGLPMTIVETDGVSALCEFRGERRRVSMLLLSDLPVGSKVLVHIDTAIRLLDEVEARLIAEAIEGLTAVLGGEDCDRFFADLIEREPQLPEHLRFDQRPTFQIRSSMSPASRAARVGPPRMKDKFHSKPSLFADAKMKDLYQ